MNKHILLVDIAKLFMTHPILLDDSICFNDEIYWDSLSQISIIAAIRTHYNVTIHYAELMACETLGELFNLIETRLETVSV